MYKENISEKQVLKVLDKWDVPCIELHYAVTNDLNDIPFLVLDHTTYFGIEAHLFTLGEAAGWDPSFGAHGFDVFLHTKEYDEKAIEKAWERLTFVTLEFGEYLESYRDLVNPHAGYIYCMFRSRRGLFSCHYSDGELNQSGFLRELEVVESKYSLEDDDQ